MRRTSMQLAAVILAGGLAVSACSSLKLGAAATTSRGRISSATLTNEVANLSAAYTVDERKGVKPQRPAAQMPQQVLTWLLTFRVYDELASQHGITVTAADIQHQLTGLTTQAAQSKASLSSYVSAAGAVPPDLLPKIGRYFAILSAFEIRLDGGKSPTSQTGQTALQTRIAGAQCLAAKKLRIKVNPQYGEFDYSTYAVVAATSKLAAAAPATPSASASAKPRLTPAC